MKKHYVSMIWSTERTRHYRFTGWKKAVALVAPSHRREMEKRLDAREAAVA